MEPRSIVVVGAWNHALSPLEEKHLVDLKLLYLFFDASLIV
jgi:hypothetical protein